MEREGHQEAAQNHRRVAGTEDGIKRKAGGGARQEVHLEKGVARGGEGEEIGKNINQSAVAVDPAGSVPEALLAVPVTRRQLKEDNRKLRES